MQTIKREIAIFFAALTFLTRIPAPTCVPFKAEYLNSAAHYFPLVGLLIATISIAAYWLALPLYGHLLAILLSIAATVFLTGAFHEDGFADFCDGFGGGWEKIQILAIMKDSRLGTYAALGIGLLIACKVQLLNLCPSYAIPMLIIIGHTSSRALAASYLFNYPYVQDTETSKVKPLATAMSGKSLIFTCLCGLLPLMLLPLTAIASVVIALLIFRSSYGFYLKKKLGGYTGDCLGAAQQMSELLIYLILLPTLMNTA